jgi:HEAT repeat protein
MPPVSADARSPEVAADLALDPGSEAIVVAALGCFPRSGIVGPVARLLTALRPEARADGLRLLGLVGDARELVTLCKAVARPDPTDDPDSAEAALLRGSTCAILGRDRSAYATIRTLLREVPSTIRYHLAWALADSGSAAALGVLTAQLGAHPDEDSSLLDGIARLAATVELPVDECIPQTVRLYLDCEDPSCARAAAQALGGMQDCDSISDLIQALPHPHPDVALAALNALHEITGADLLPDPERWTSWLAQEQAWFETDAPRLGDDLADSDPLRVMAAVAAMAAHPRYRFEIAARFQRVLPGADPEILTAACAALRELGAQSAVPFLEDCLVHPAAEVAAAAEEALSSLRSKRPGRVTAQASAQGQPPLDR